MPVIVRNYRMYKEWKMPIITFENGHLTKEQKAELVCEFTDTASRITGIARQAFVVLIKENDTENIGVGGELLCERLKKK